ncbi:hypothetical protein ABIA70_000467 [Arthrobacter sp. 754]
MNPPDPSPEPDPGQPGSGESASGDGSAGPQQAAAVERPRGIVVIALIVAAEATALLVAAAWYGYELLTNAPVLSFAGAVFTLGLLLAFSAWLYAVAAFLLRGRRWTRAAALVAQLFVLTIGFPTLTGGVVLAGIAMLVPAVTALVLLFDKRVISYASRTGDLPPAL